ncbi:MAG: aminoacyl-tRNA hydrolase [Spirochaetales bacterium]|nr:aminoacyl-tRNA hydrolase [Spirochaetales bacterium]MCF7937999.1 aminoacyl-tRNA hydrolase [Spirochaetales bacterium]
MKKVSKAKKSKAKKRRKPDTGIPNLNRILIGLGNPGERYRFTRHNAGFLVLDKIAELRGGLRYRRPLFASYRYALVSYGNNRSGDGQNGNAASGQSGGKPGSLVCVKPLTYMNRSGEVLPPLAKRFSSEMKPWMVVLDTLDLPAGKIRIKQAGGTAGHKGLASLLDFAESPDFFRLYVGIGRPSGGVPVARYVLEEPRGKEAEGFRQAIEDAASAALRLLEAPLEQVRNEINRRENS